MAERSERARPAGHVGSFRNGSKTQRLTTPLVQRRGWRGEGECRAWSTLFTGLCRAAGVPARHFWGMVIILPDEKNPKGAIRSHVWAEVYLTGAGWIPVDPQDANLFGFLPNTYVRIFMDTRKLKTSQENLPALNLRSMGSDGFRFERVK